MAFTTAINTSLLTTWLNKTFIPALDRELVMYKFVTKAVIPKGAGNIGRFNVYAEPAGNTAPLTEGSTGGNEITTMTTTGTDITIREYGENIKVNDLLVYAAVGEQREKLRDRMSLGAAISIDSIIRTYALNTTTAFYAGAGASGGSTTAAIPTVGSAAALVGAKRILRDNKTRGFRGVGGHKDGNYAAWLSPKYELDMVTEGSTGRITWQNAVVNVNGDMGQSKVINGNLGPFYGVSTYITQNLTQTAITSTSDNNFVVSDGGLGAMAFRDMDPKILITPINGPYQNANWIAWHIMFGAAIIDSARVVRLYSLAI